MAKYLNMVTLPVKSPVKIENTFDFSAKLLCGDEISLSRYKGKVLLIVNIALADENTSKELKQLNELVSKFGQKLVVLAFLCNQFGHKVNFTKEEEILSTLKHVRPGNDFSPRFPVFAPINVNGKGTDDLFRYLRQVIGAPSDDPLSLANNPGEITWFPVTRTDIAWNFEKFLIAPDGKPYKRFSSHFSSIKTQEDIKILINKYDVKTPEVNGIRFC